MISDKARRWAEACFKKEERDQGWSSGDDRIRSRSSRHSRKDRAPESAPISQGSPGRNSSLNFAALPQRYAAISSPAHVAGLFF